MIENIDEKAEEDFDKAFTHYWYHRKKWTRRLSDDMSREHSICLEFFATLNEIGMLDKIYPMELEKNINELENETTEGEDGR